MLVLRRRRLPRDVRLRLRRAGPVCGARAEDERVPARAQHSGHHLGRHRRRRGHRIRPAAAVETVHHHPRSARVCPLREGTTDGEMGYSKYTNNNQRFHDDDDDFLTMKIVQLISSIMLCFRFSVVLYFRAIQGENPIYKQATSTFKNPTYGGKQ